MSYNPILKNTAYIFYISLESQTAVGFQSNPTLAAGDVKLSGDGGALTNLATLPVVTPAGSKLVKVSLSAAEMNYDNVNIIFSDAAGAEWYDLSLNIQTTTTLGWAATVADISNDADARSNIGKMLRAIFNRLYDRVDQTSTTQAVYNDSGVATSSMTVSDDSVTAIKGKSS